MSRAAVFRLGVALVVSFGVPACLGGQPLEGPSATAVDGGLCTGTLDQVARGVWSQTACPEHFDAVSPAALCGTEVVGAFERRSGGRCADGQLVYVVDFSTHSRRCFYDATSRALVGAIASDDTTSFCGRTSWTIQAGAVGACANRAPDQDAESCGDGGVDAAR